MKTYLVPILVTGQFGGEAYIQANSIKEARQKVAKGKFDLRGDGYDWNRWSETKYEVGDWQKIKEAEEDDLPCE